MVALTWPGRVGAGVAASAATAVQMLVTAARTPDRVPLVPVLVVAEAALGTLAVVPSTVRVRWPEGVSPSGSHRSRRGRLRSPGSCHPGQ